MGILRSLCRQRNLLLLSLAVVEAACCFAQAKSPAPAMPVQSLTQGQNAQAAAKIETPFQRVIGAHLDDWQRAAVAANAKASRSAAVLQSQAAYARVNPPAFLSAPTLTLPLDSNFDNGISSMVSGDFNHDGKLDVAIVRPAGFLEVVLNPGSFSNIPAASVLPANESATASLPNITSLYVADVNGDSNLDLIGMDIANTQVVIWLGKGDGTFGTATTLSVTPSTGASWANGSGTMVVADINGDGFPDIAVLAATPTSSNKTTAISAQTFLNLGNGTFAAGKEVDATFNDVYTIGYGSADIISRDGAGVTGLAFAVTDVGTATPANFGTDLIILSSGQDGTFSVPVEPSSTLVPSQSIQAAVRSTNLNAKFTIHPTDGTVGTGIPTKDLLLSVGDGIIYDIPYAAGSTAPLAPVALIGAYGEFGATGSVSIPVATNTGLALPNVIGMVLDDFDGDGYQDILALSGGAAFIFPNNGAGAFTAPPTQTAGMEGTNLVAADFDGEKRESFVWADAQLGMIGYYHNLGTANGGPSGQFYSAPAVSGATASSAGGNTVFANTLAVNAVADVNGDGVLDVIGTNLENIYRNGIGVGDDLMLGLNNSKNPQNGSTRGFTFSTILSGAAQVALLGNGSIVQPFTVKNGSKTTIVLTSGSDSTAYAMTGDTSGHFADPVPLSYGSLAPTCGMDYGDAGDINGDGIVDIVLAYQGDFDCKIPAIPGRGAVASGYFIFLGNADGTFQPATYTALGTSLYKLRLMNLSGVGGRLDIVAIDSFSPNGGGSAAYGVYIVPGHADGTFGTPLEVATNYIASDVVAGDYNSDGYPDITITTLGQYDPSSGLIIGNTTGVLQIPGLGGYNFGYPVIVADTVFPATAAYNDVNDDGSPDLVVSAYWDSTSFYPPHILINYVSSLLIYPNLGGGALGPAISEPLAPYPPYLVQANRWSGSPLFLGNFGSSSGSDILLSGSIESSLFLNQGLPALQLAASSTTAMQNAPVTLTATLMQGGNAMTGASGVVTFSLGSTSLGSASLADGIATLQTSALPVGSDTVTATYVGDSDTNNLTSTTAVTIQALAPQFTMALASGNLSLTQGATGTALLSLASNASFTGTIAFTCTGAPAEASCAVSPSTLNLGGSQSANVSVVIATTAKNNQYQASVSHPWTVLSAGAGMAGFILLLIPRRRRRRTIINLLSIVMIAVGSINLLTGCSGGGDRYPGTPVGTSTLTINATSGSLTQTATVTIAVMSSDQ